MQEFDVASVSRRGEMRWGRNLPNGETVLLLLFSLGQFSCTDFLAFCRSVPLLHQDPYLPCLFCCLTFLFLAEWYQSWFATSPSGRLCGELCHPHMTVFRMCKAFSDSLRWSCSGYVESTGGSSFPIRTCLLQMQLHPRLMPGYHNLGFLST